MKGPSIEETLSELGTIFVKEMKSLIKLNGKFATGELYNSVKSKVFKDQKEVYHLEIDYIYYGLFIDQGRRPGMKQPPLKDILAWCRLKGLPDDAAFPIARKIGQKGFKGIHFTKPFENDMVVIKRIVNEMGEEFQNDALEKILRDEKYFKK